ncbi:hypothetical protein IFM89_033832 [Coptis chinensis]|uniref:Uncharacterized protein n=1 Tax=Coptis chinensis TaxID=261450 RepID=A0A835HRH6_9MAGN|nr:hypothetical protein IFM89_033832 [Coptis chinensis]
MKLESRGVMHGYVNGLDLVKLKLNLVLRFVVWFLMDTAEMNESVLALTDNVVMPISAVLNAIEEHGVKGIEQNDPLIITQALSLSKFT